MHVKTRRRDSRMWSRAVFGSVAVAIAIAIAALSVGDAVSATIATIAIVTIVLLALWSGRRHSCDTKAEPRFPNSRRI
jgi:hypothetical protein